MKRKIEPAHLIALSAILLIALLLSFVAGRAVEASGGPVAKQDPTCDDSARVGSVIMNPGGTKNAMEQIVFDVPFCTDELAAFATVRNGNTAGESVGAMPWGVEAVNISVQLRHKSYDLYTVFWEVKLITE